MADDRPWGVVPVNLSECDGWRQTVGCCSSESEWVWWLTTDHGVLFQWIWVSVMADDRLRGVVPVNLSECDGWRQTVGCCSSESKWVWWLTTDRGVLFQWIWVSVMADDRPWGVVPVDLSECDGWRQTVGCCSSGSEWVWWLTTDRGVLFQWI